MGAACGAAGRPPRARRATLIFRRPLTTILLTNAWELALKAALRQAGKSLFYRTKRGEKYRSVSLQHALVRVTNSKLWPDRIDGSALTANISALTEFRDRAIHLYNAQGLGALIYPFLQQNVLNYRDFVLARFGKDLADSVTWQLLPLAATAPADSVSFMRVDKNARMVAVAQEFVEDLRKLLAEAEASGSDMARVAMVYDISLQSVKKVTSADLAVAVVPTANGRVAIRKTDPNETHPHSATELLAKVNQRRNGRHLTTRDYQAICWKEGLRDQPRYAWRHMSSQTTSWSGDAVSYLAALDDARYDQVRREYRAELRMRHAAAK
ncbi:MAG: DUF3644 domain-containing protein [Bifidobacteriaceae bacterium]|nr:DUF3644 domain-containing protein [Bifidobacteriaceae bacterium]